MTNTEIKTLLITYVELILKCENILKEKYGIDGIPYANQQKLPKKDEISTNDGTLKYNFHGSGCTFFLDGIEISYDTYIISKDYLVTSPWKFLQFLNSYLKVEEVMTEEKIDLFFLEFEQDGTFRRISLQFWGFQIIFDRVFNKNYGSC